MQLSQSHINILNRIQRPATVNIDIKSMRNILFIIDNYEYSMFLSLHCRLIFNNFNLYFY